MNEEEEIEGKPKCLNNSVIKQNTPIILQETLQSNVGQLDVGKHWSHVAKQRKKGINEYLQGFQTKEEIEKRPTI